MYAFTTIVDTFNPSSGIHFRPLERQGSRVHERTPATRRHGPDGQRDHNDGRDDIQYFADFEGAWQTLMKSLKPQHREIFRDEIDFRLQEREFQFCGTLGKEFIPL